MDLITRYLFRQTASALIMILTTLTAIVWLSSALRQLTLITSQGQGFLIFLQITSLAIPNLIAIVAPIALLIASLHTLNRLNGDSELIVLTAAGSNVWRVLKPYLYLALIVAVLTLLVNAYVLPKSTQIMRDLIAQVRADIISQVLQPGQFTNPDKGLTFHIRDRAPNGELLGMMVHDERDPKRIMTYLADHARIVEQNGSSYLIMYDGHINRQIAGNPEVKIVAFQSYIFDLAQMAARDNKGNDKDQPKPREMYLSELLTLDTSQNEYYRNNRGKFRAELHERLSNPLYPIFFVMLAIVHLGYARTTREGRAESLTMAFTVGAICRVVGLAANNLAAKKLWAVGLLWGVPLVGITATLLMLAFNIKPLKFPSISFKLPSFRSRRKKDIEARQGLVS